MLVSEFLVVKKNLEPLIPVHFMVNNQSQRAQYLTQSDPFKTDSVGGGGGGGARKLPVLRGCPYSAGLHE